MALDALNHREASRRHLEPDFYFSSDDESSHEGRDGGSGGAAPKTAKRHGSEVRDRLAASMNDDIGARTTTSPISVPKAKRGDLHAQVSASQRDDSPDRPPPKRQNSLIQFAPRVRLENGSQPALEEKLPRLTLSTRPRGRSLLDELARKRGTSGEDLRQEPSALRNVSTASWVGAKREIVPARNGVLNSSPPIDESSSSSAAPNDALAEAYASPTTYTPMSGSPQSAAGSWLGMYTSRSSSFRRRSQRSGTNSMHDSPAANFLRQYSSSSVSTAPRSPDAEGQEVGDYILGKQVGAGGFSIVREAYSSVDPSSKSKVAVKIVRRKIPSLTEAENDEAQTLLDREMIILRSIEHEGIIRVNDLRSTDFATFAFMPLASHGSLFDAVKKVQNIGLELDLVRKYAGQMAETLRYLHHDARIIHRDIKLENFLLISDHGHSSHQSDYFNQTPRVVLTDFGLASSLPDNQVDLLVPDCTDGYDDKRPVEAGVRRANPSSEELPRGSLHYAAPETLHPPKGKQPPLSPRPDMWAFGVMLYAMITGKRPFVNSFEPKLIECIKAGDWDRTLLEERCNKPGVANEDGEQVIKPGSGAPGDVSHDGKLFKKSHGCREGGERVIGSRATNITSAGIAKNDAWARSCNTIIVSDGIDPQAVAEVVKGCLTTDPSDRWEIMQVVESAWLASEQKLD